MRRLKQAAWLAAIVLLIYYVAKHPAHSDTVVHNLASGAVNVGQSLATFIGGL